MSERLEKREATTRQFGIDPHLPIHGLRDSFGAWVRETHGVKQAQEWLGHSDPATTLRHYVRLTTAARVKAVAGRFPFRPTECA